MKGQAQDDQKDREQSKKDDEHHQNQDKHSKETDTDAHPSAKEADTDAHPSAKEAPAVKQQQDASSTPSQPDQVQQQLPSQQAPSSVTDQADAPETTEDDDDFPAVTEPEDELDQQEKTVVAESFFEGYGIAAGHGEDEFGGLGLIGVFEESNVSSIGASLDSSYRLNMLAIVSLFLMYYYMLARQK